MKPLQQVGNIMRQVLAVAALLLLAVSLSGCMATLQSLNGQSGQWHPSLAQTQAASNLIKGRSTIAEVEGIYGLDCPNSALVKPLSNCFIVGTVGKDPEVELTYMTDNVWSPSCDTDVCPDSYQETFNSYTYVFNTAGVFEKQEFTSECTAHVGEYIFKNGCIDHE
jgi:hypothetical protein